MGHRLMVGHLPLKQRMSVRITLAQWSKRLPPTRDLHPGYSAIRRINKMKKYNKNLKTRRLSNLCFLHVNPLTYSLTNNTVRSYTTNVIHFVSYSPPISRYNIRVFPLISLYKYKLLPTIYRRTMKINALPKDNAEIFAGVFLRIHAHFYGAEAPVYTNKFELVNRICRYMLTNNNIEPIALRDAMRIYFSHVGATRKEILEICRQVEPSYQKSVVFLDDAFGAEGCCVVDYVAELNVVFQTQQTIGGTLYLLNDKPISHEHHLAILNSQYCPDLYSERLRTYLDVKIGELDLMRMRGHLHLIMIKNGEAQNILNHTDIKDSIVELTKNLKNFLARPEYKNIEAITTLRADLAGLSQLASVHEKITSLNSLIVQTHIVLNEVLVGRKVFNPALIVTKEVTYTDQETVAEDPLIKSLAAYIEKSPVHSKEDTLKFVHFVLKLYPNSSLESIIKHASSVKAKSQKWNLSFTTELIEKCFKDI